jgi:hypothetical protein
MALSDTALQWHHSSLLNCTGIIKRDSEVGAHPLTAAPQLKGRLPPLPGCRQIVGHACIRRLGMEALQSHTESSVRSASRSRRSAHQLMMANMSGAQGYACRPKRVLSQPESAPSHHQCSRVNAHSTRRQYSTAVAHLHNDVGGLQRAADAKGDVDHQHLRRRGASSVCRPTRPAGSGAEAPAPKATSLHAPSGLCTKAELQNRTHQQRLA